MTSSPANQPSLFEKICQGPKDGRLPAFFNMAMQQKLLTDPEPYVELMEVEKEQRVFGSVFNYVHRRFENENLIYNNSILLSEGLRDWLCKPSIKKTAMPVTNLIWLVSRFLSPFDRIYDLKTVKGVHDIYMELAIRYYITMDLPPGLLPDAVYDYVGEDYPQACTSAAPHLPLSRGFAYIWRNFISEVPFNPSDAAARNLVFMRMLVFLQMTELDERIFSKSLIRYLNSPLFPTTHDGVQVTGLIYEVFRLAGFGDNPKWNEPDFALDMVKRFFSSAFSSLLLPPSIIQPHVAIASKLGVPVNSKAMLPSGNKARKKFMMEDVPALPVNTAKAWVNIVETGEGNSPFNSITRKYTQAMEIAKIPALILLPPFDPYTKYITAGSLENAPWGTINFFSAPLQKMADVMLSHGLGYFKGRINIGYCNWETSKLPRAHALGLELLDEVWVASEYQKQIFAAATDKPVLVMPYPIEVLKPTPYMDRSAFGIPEDTFVFMTIVDCSDWLSRKNALAVEEAFRAAFPNNEKVTLIVKSRFLDKAFCSREDHYIQHMQTQAQNDPRILLYHQDLSDGDMAAFMQCADSYVSLHRSTAFGRAIAEMMLMGKPVIVTHAAGVCDYVNADNAALIEAVPCSIIYDSYQYITDERGHTWFDADAKQTADAMRRMVTDRAYASRIAKAGQETIARKYNAVVTGSAMRQRIETLMKQTTGIAA